MKCKEKAEAPNYEKESCKQNVSAIKELAYGKWLKRDLWVVVPIFKYSSYLEKQIKTGSILASYQKVYAIEFTSITPT
jgi:hypothetical protein